MWRVAARLLVGQHCARQRAIQLATLPDALRLPSRWAQQGRCLSTTAPLLMAKRVPKTVASALLELEEVEDDEAAADEEGVPRPRTVSKGPTPAMRQYLEIKKNYPYHILMFRMGDFYEMFYEDAARYATGACTLSCLPHDLVLRPRSILLLPSGEAAETKSRWRASPPTQWRPTLTSSFGKT